MKILILRFSSIGDIVLTTPVIRTLKTHDPSSEIHFATKSAYHFVLKANPYLDKIHLLEDSLQYFIKDLKEEQFDLIIDLHHNLRTALIKLALRRPTRTFNKLNFQKFLLTQFNINTLPNVHIVDRYMSCVDHLNVKMDSLGLDYFISEKDEVELTWLPTAFHQGFIAVVIGAKHFTKRLPEEKLIELCDRINKPIVLLGGAEDQELANKIEAFFNTEDEKAAEIAIQLGKKAIIFNGCGKFNFNQSASLVKQASMVFTHDTGLMHVAAAYKKDIFSIWGSTVPEFGMYPYRTKFTIFENKKLDCRPCSKIGFDQCPKKHFKCMKEIKFDFYLPD